MSTAAGPTFGGTYRRLLGYLRPEAGIAVLAVIGMVFDAASSAAFMQLIKPMLNDLFIRRDPHTIVWLPIAIVVLFVVRGLATYVTGYGMARIGRDIVFTLRRQVFRRYLGLPAAFFDHEPVGQQIARLIYTVEQVAAASTETLKTLILHSLTVIGLIAVMLYNSVRLTLTLFVLAPVVLAIAWYVGRRYRRISARIQTSMGEVGGIVEEVVAGRREVRIYGGRDYESGRFDAASDDNRRLNLKIASTSALSTALVQFVAACALAAVVFIATRPKIITTMDPGSFMAVITSMMVMLTSLKQLMTVQSGMQRGVAAAHDLFAVIDAPPELDTGHVAVARSRGELELRDVTLVYPGQRAGALRGVSLHCQPGTLTAVVGRSGSGKTSLASLIPRFNEPTSGTVLLDGRPLADYTLDSLRAQIAWVGQDVLLFNDTIRRNIAYGALGDASTERITAAADAANAMGFIRSLPDGLDSETGGHGALLSGGERQRIAIARALLKDAPIVILDEATSALDAESERLIRGAMEQLMRERTMLVIAHRLSTVEGADQIIVLDEGRVVERGTHATLLAAGGTYAALYRMQFRDDESDPGAAREPAATEA